VAKCEQVKALQSPDAGAAPASFAEIGITPEQLREARKGFEALLLSKGFKRPFLTANVDDLMGRAQVELVGKSKRGERIESPVGLLITIAYRRAQNLLTSKERAPDFVGIEAVAEVADDEDAGPENATLNRDREAKVREAVARLTVDERKIVALEFFRQMNLSQAARELGWDESKARRRHKAAMAHLHDLLGVDSADDLVIDIAFFCWLVTALRLPVKFSLVRELETVGEWIGDGIAALAGRVEHVAHRGNEQLAGNPAAASVAEGAGRAAKLCGAAALCAVAVGVATVAQHGSPKPPTREAAKTQASPRTGTARAVSRHASPVASPSASGTQDSQAPAASRRREAATPEGDGRATRQAVGEATSPHPSQPSPQVATEALEETSRPEAGPQVSLPAVGPDGESVENSKKAGGESAAASRASSEFRGLLE
jgi:RNA polymerase sigma factor (sigma-70 family)